MLARPRKFGWIVLMAVAFSWTGCDDGPPGSPFDLTEPDGEEDAATDVSSEVSSGDVDGDTRPHDADAADASGDADIGVADVSDTSDIDGGDAGSCDDDGDCADGSHCVSVGAERTRCRKARSCRSHIICAEGELCLPRNSEDDRHCLPTDTGRAGESCQLDRECRSGECRAGACAERCRVDADCGDGERCKIGSGYCIETTCEVECSRAPICNVDDCTWRHCQRTRDCGEEDDCIGAAAQSETEFGRCESFYQECEADEFRIRLKDPYCRIPVQCEKGQHEQCPRGYYCAINAAPDDGETVYWCSRRIARWEWPPE